MNWLNFAYWLFGMVIGCLSYAVAHFCFGRGASEAQPAARGLASTAGSAPALASPLSESATAGDTSAVEAAVVNLVSSAPVERFDALSLCLKVLRRVDRDDLTVGAGTVRLQPDGDPEPPLYGELQEAIKNAEVALAANDRPAVGGQAKSSRSERRG